MIFTENVDFIKEVLGADCNLCFTIFYCGWCGFRKNVFKLTITELNFILRTLKKIAKIIIISNTKHLYMERERNGTKETGISKKIMPS